MSGSFLTWLGAAMAIFLAASTALRAYVSHERIGLVVLALILYSLGNLVMVRLMREGGMAVAVSVSAVLQLVFANAVAIAVFGERPPLQQVAGIALGVVAIGLILFPSGTPR